MILNRQRGARVSLAELARFCERARRVVGLPKDSVTVCLVSDAEMARLNRAFRGKRGPTDVLSFPAEANGTTRAARNGTYVGDIAIAPGVARRNARRFGRTLRDELRVLVLHGLLHLAGYDHETDAGEMERLERRLRHRLGLSDANVAGRE